MVVLLIREVVGWSSGFRAVMHQRWVRLLAWITPPSCAEPMCEAKRTHHPSLGLEESVRPDGLRFKLFIYKYSVFGIWTEQADGDNPCFEFRRPPRCRRRRGTREKCRLK